MEKLGVRRKGKKARVSQSPLPPRRAQRTQPAHTAGQMEDVASAARGRRVGVHRAGNICAGGQISGSSGCGKGLWTGCGEGWEEHLPHPFRRRQSCLNLMLLHSCLTRYCTNTAVLCSHSPALPTSLRERPTGPWDVPPLPTLPPSLTMSWKSPFACPDRPSALPALSLN